MHLWKALTAMLLCLCMLFSFAFAQENPVNDASSTLTVTFLGDCTLGSEDQFWERDTSFVYYINQYGYDYPFALVQDVIGKDDLTVANLENVFYEYTANKAEKTYCFRAPTAFSKILTAGSVEAVNLSNNHTEDYGARGIRKTVETLEAEGIGWFGTTEYADGVYIYEKNGIKIGFVGMYLTYWWAHNDMLKNNFQKLYDAECDVIVGIMHGGTEYSFYHEAAQDKLADYMIKMGASVVVGHHPHVLQGVYVKNNATVVYSLGNFVFGGNKAMRAYQSAMAQFTFCFDENGEYTGHQLNIIPCQYSGSREYNDYRPFMFTGTEAEKVIEAMRRDSNIRLNPYVEGVGAVQDFVPAPEKTVTDETVH